MYCIPRVNIYCKISSVYTFIVRWASMSNNNGYYRIHIFVYVTTIQIYKSKKVFVFVRFGPCVLLYLHICTYCTYIRTYILCFHNYIILIGIIDANWRKCLSLFPHKLMNLFNNTLIRKIYRVAKKVFL